MARPTTRLDEFAEDLGKLLGTAQSKAEGWLNQRQSIAKQLTGIRDTAQDLLQQLTGGGARMAAAVRRGRKKAKPGIPVVQPGMRASRKKRVMSAATKAKMRAAAKARWAAIRK